MTLCVAVVLAACGGGEPGPRDFGVPADRVDDVEEVTTPEGDVVYWIDPVLYGPCDVLEPHDGAFGEWLGPEFDGAGFGCVD